MKLLQGSHHTTVFVTLASFGSELCATTNPEAYVSVLSLMWNAPRYFDCEAKILNGVTSRLQNNQVL